MSRWAVPAFVVVVLILVLLAVQPREERGEVVEEIRLDAAEVRLYPAGDPEAHWRFEAAEVVYDSGTGETTLLEIRDGERRVGDVLDFTLAAQRLVIGNDDDLRAPRMDVHLVEDELDVEMEGADDRLVLVDQDEGRFEVPRIHIFGDDFGESRYENMRVSFDFTSFESGGAGTIGYSELQLGERGGGPGGGAPDGGDDAP